MTPENVKLADRLLLTLKSIDMIVEALDREKDKPYLGGYVSISVRISNSNLTDKSEFLYEPNILLDGLRAMRNMALNQLRKMGVEI